MYSERGRYVINIYRICGKGSISENNYKSYWFMMSMIVSKNTPYVVFLLITHALAVVLETYIKLSYPLVHYGKFLPPSLPLVCLSVFPSFLPVSLFFHLLHGIYVFTCSSP